MEHPLSPPTSSNPHQTLILDYPDDPPTSAINLLPPSPATSSPDSSSSTSALQSSPPTHHSSSHSNQDHLLDSFSQHCQKMFYEADPNSTRAVEQIIRHLPAASKATFTKQMATIRSQFHRDAANSRRAEVDKLLLDTLPSSIIIKSVGQDSSLSAMRSPRARQERKDRLQKFINSHCVRDMVGVHPFFSSLCAVLHLLLTPARKGGSGKRRVEWDIDLALFCEAGGEPFLRDSIEFLKGVLGFEDHLKPLATPSFVSSTYENHFDPDEDEDVPPDMVIGHSDGDDGLTLEERQEIEVDEEEATNLGLNSNPSDIELPRRRPTNVGTLRGSDDPDEEGPFADSSSPSIEDDDLSIRAPICSSSQLGKGKSVAGPENGHGRSIRHRPISDPFIDPRPLMKSSFRPPPISSPRITVSPAVEDLNSTTTTTMMNGLMITTGHDLPPTPSSSSSSSSTPKAKALPDLPNQTHRRTPTQNSLDAPQPTEIRIFRSPSYLTNPELKELIETFPSFISVRCRYLKFNSKGEINQAHLQHKLRHDQNRSKSNGINSYDHIHLSVFERDPNWKGSFIERVKLFLFRLFGI